MCVFFPFFPLFSVLDSRLTLFLLPLLQDGIAAYEELMVWTVDEGRTTLTFSED